MARQKIGKRQGKGGSRVEVAASQECIIDLVFEVKARRMDLVASCFRQPDLSSEVYMMNPRDWIWTGARYVHRNDLAALSGPVEIKQRGRDIGSTGGAIRGDLEGVPESGDGADLHKV